ncbi:sigma-70 family RNA polymerase sigma factor [Chitinophaga sp. G-6-1-13]|uniref:Sigma-70 family RNA polymerase sigma factor n=1 Tax=Chitinophaga fulva TaxID=2728842 RepID=A0A848GUK7_9BACT|nr:sigma-70 family RNA polymerase sigma factor [Chitinophaga fulva]NML41161.1 sigma-70 family RNA polymerase sigma factor [Chitinophaga fulva]
MTNTSEQHPFAFLESKERYEVFKSHYAQYSGAIFKAILVIVKDTHLAEETLQDVFVKVWKSMEQYDARKGSLYTWLHRIAHNTALDAVRRKNNKNNKKNELLSIENALIIPVVMPEFKDEMGLRKAVSSLKEKQRIPIELFFFQEYTLEAIAKELNIPLGTIKSRYYSALRKLYKMIKKQR